MTAHALACEVTTQNVLSMPDAVFRLNQLLDKPGVTHAMIGELLMTDPALSARVLKLANCALYGGSGKVDTISRAIAMLGLNRIRSLAMTTFMAQAFEGIPEDLVDMDRFWLNSIATGVICRSLAFRCRMFDTELLYLAGLLLKLGRLVFYCSRPEQYLEVLRVKDLGELALIVEERRVFGYDYCELGAELMQLWHLPPTLYKVIEEQAAPLSDVTYPKETAIVRIASELAQVIEPGVNLPHEIDLASVVLDEDALALLGISTAMFPALILDVWVQVFEVMGTVRPQATAVF